MGCFTGTTNIDNFTKWWWFSEDGDFSENRTFAHISALGLLDSNEGICLAMAVKYVDTVEYHYCVYTGASLYIGNCTWTGVAYIGGNRREQLTPRFELIDAARRGAGITGNRREQLTPRFELVSDDSYMEVPLSFVRSYQ